MNEIRGGIDEINARMKRNTTWMSYSNELCEISGQKIYEKSTEPSFKLLLILHQ